MPGELNYNEPSLCLDLLLGRGWQCPDRNETLLEIDHYLDHISCGPGEYDQDVDRDENGMAWEEGGAPFFAALEAHLSDCGLLFGRGLAPARHRYVARIDGRARTQLIIVHGADQREALRDARRYAEQDPVQLLGRLVDLDD